MFRKSLILSLLAVALTGSVARAAPGTLVNDSIIDPLAHNFPTASYSVATVHGVSFQQDGVTTYKGWQYAAYYQGNFSDSTGKVAIARRPLPSGAWQTLVLGDYTFSTVDSHNDVVLGICAGDGTIHLSFDHHVNNLHYRASVSGLADNPTTTAWTAAQFGAVTDHLIAGSATMSQVTYPRFIPTPNGKLLFTHRFGSSGGGDEVLYEYDGTTHAWSRPGQYTTRTGSYTGTLTTGVDRNAYFDNTIFDSNGRLHATWCWRETPDAASNHDVLYAYSDDVGRTWKNQLGNTVAVTGTSFISVNSPGIIGWSVPQKRNYINNSAMTVDRQGRVHVVAWLLPSSAPDQTTFSTDLTSASRFVHFWRGTDGVWRKNETSFTGTRAKLSVDDDGRLFLIYGDATNIRIAAANPAADPEASPANSWNDWAQLALSGALPSGKANTVNIINDTARWEADRIISVYAQETNISGTGPTPLHVLDYHVSRAAVLPVPLTGVTIPTPGTDLSWTAGQEAAQHDVYLGTNAGTVAAATTASPVYLGRQSTATRASGTLAPSTTYYWRVDSVSSSSTITKGRVWSFTTGNGAPVVTNGASTRGAGTAITFRGNLTIPVSATTDVALYWGNADGGEITSNWEHAVPLGPQPAGPLEITVPATSSDAVFYRFRASNTYGTAWASAAGTLPSLAPFISQAAASRSYGGRGIFQISLDPGDAALSSGDVVFYCGASDGGTNPASWDRSISLGSKAAGSQSVTIDGLPAGALQFRFKVSTVHGTEWASASGTLDASGDLSSWARSAVIEITGYSGTSTLTNFPVLLRLSPALIPGFTYAGLLSPPYGDLRFSSLDGTVIPHEVETWDTLGVSLVWVKLPQLSQGTKLRVWWGKTGQSATATSPTWSAFNGVWHLDNALGFSTDSSPNTLSAAATSVTSAASGIIPGAAALNGTASNVAINNGTALNPSLLSIEAWVKTSVSTGTPSIFSKDQTSGGTNRVWQFRLNAGKPEFLPFNASANGTVTSPDAVSDNQFHHLCGTWDGATVKMYVDGVLKASSALAGILRTGQTNKAFIGRSENTTANYFAGSIDEVRLSPVARSADWVGASFDNQKVSAAFVTGSPSSTPDLDGDLLPDAWEMQYFASTFITDPDPDADGLSSLLEFALGTDPTSGADRPELALNRPAGAAPPEFVFEQIAGGTGNIGTSYTASGMRYSVEISSDLSTWMSGPAVVAWSNRREALPGGMERVGVYVIDPPLAASPGLYSRLRVTTVP
ncbi:MAG: BNR-4 repeat-containing protein [Luteolibacter sp.]|uniref:BNR-4 repeat-containing protein n=1 Tax=Luteolibacter sp. TaxID=1962973 RepID=UPI00326727CC